MVADVSQQECPTMRLRLVSLAAILAVVAPAAPVWALSPDSGSVAAVAALPEGTAAVVRP
jgi:hypothetical protein